MTRQETIQSEQETLQHIRIKSTERDCPRCEAVLVHNNNEQCFECLNCGYIDCGEDE